MILAFFGCLICNNKRIINKRNDVLLILILNINNILIEHIVNYFLEMTLIYNVIFFISLNADEFIMK